jgi:Domain of unknown function (DUF4604)
MSFNSKNLHYEKKEPAFLRRLKGQNTSERHSASIVRPRKPRLETGDDDGPTLVDEHGENVTEQEYQDLLDGRTRDDCALGNGSSAEKPDPMASSWGTQPDGTGGRARERETRYTVVNSGPRKRKQVKAVAVEAEPEAAPLKAENGSLTTEAKDKPKSKMTVKKKKIKLSFDDPES